MLTLIIQKATTTTPTQQQAPTLGINSKGTINSLITTPTAMWIATGDWSMNVNNGSATFLEPI